MNVGASIGSEDTDVNADLSDYLKIVTGLAVQSQDMHAMELVDMARQCFDDGLTQKGLLFLSVARNLCACDTMLEAFAKYVSRFYDRMMSL